jgi:hypothetical protein
MVRDAGKTPPQPGSSTVPTEKFNAVVSLATYRQQRALRELELARESRKRERNYVRAYKLGMLSGLAADFAPPSTSRVSLGAWLYGMPERQALVLAAIAEASSHLDEGFASLAAVYGAIDAVSQALGWGKKAADRVAKELIETGSLHLMPDDRKHSGGLAWGNFERSTLVAGETAPAVKTPDYLVQDIYAAWFLSTQAQRKRKLDRMLRLLVQLDAKLGWQSGGWWKDALEFCLEREGLI